MWRPVSKQMQHAAGRNVDTLAAIANTVLMWINAPRLWIGAMRVCSRNAKD